MTDNQPPAITLAQRVAGQYAALPQVEAVALAGSQTTGTTDPTSDIDMYVYSATEIPLADRLNIATATASLAETDNRFWEPGDEWIDAATGIQVDVMFRSLVWIEDQLARLLDRHEASVGYSTCFWHNVLASQPLYDRRGWFAKLQQTARQPYPTELCQAIIAKNQPILRQTLSSYRRQIEKAIHRQDGVSITHRLAALLASYFDILFAVNRLPHPGEKRLVKLVTERCSKIPRGMSEDINNLLEVSTSGDLQILTYIDHLLDGLDELLRAEGFASFINSETY